MPGPAPRPCAAPGCPETTTDTRCARHRKQKRRREDHDRPSAAKRGYGARHRKWRAAVLRRDPVCRDPFNRHPDRVVPATEADHIEPIREGGSRFDVNNGQGLCKSCHSVKTAKENGGFIQ